MTDLDIHNFQCFLEELGRTIKELDALLEQESKHLRTIHIVYDVISKMCENWRNQLEHQK